MDRSPGQQPAQQQTGQQQVGRQHSVQPSASSHITPPNPLSQEPAALQPNVHQEHAPTAGPSHAATTRERGALAPAEAYERLRSSPEDFLKKFPIKVFGVGPNTPSGVKTYAILNRDPRPGETPSRPGSFFGTHNMHDTVSFDIRPAASLGPNHHGHVFEAHSIRADELGAAMNSYRLDANGPSIMVTGELSGCSVVMQPVDGGHVDVAHVMPTRARSGQNGQPATPAQTGQQLYNELKGSHRDAEIYGASSAKGQYDSDNRRVSIIGVRKDDGQWQLFAQKKGVSDEHIHSVYQIFPNTKKL